MKINYRQTKFLLPAVMFFPGVLVIYLVMDLFGAIGDSNKEHLAEKTDQINAELPIPNADDVDDKFTEMARRYGRKNYDSWSGISGLDNEMEEQEQIISTVPDSLSQGDELLFAEAELTQSDGGWGDDADIQRLEDALAKSRQALAEIDTDEEESPEEMEARLRKEIAAEMDAKIAALQPVPASNVAPFPAPEIGEEQVEIVEKSSKAGSDLFNTVSYASTDAAEGLIKAMIDQTTKAQDGTRIRFKLLDDVTVKGHDIKKGSYIFGTVVGFGTQRVKVAVNSILANGEFIKVRLAAYDVDGMEGFYVPASAFRELMKDAAARTAQTNLQINNGYGSAISGEMLALQALQNIYNAASSAASGQFRKNKAKIKYNTIVYLINSESL